jgi:ribosomal protein L11 methyltransferase
MKHGGAPRGRFYAFRLAVPAAREDEVVGALWEAGCLGVEVVATSLRRSAPRVALCAYFPGRAAPLPLARRLRAALRFVDLPPDRVPPLRLVADRPWAEIWQRSLRPMAIGRRFLVVPEGCRVPPARGRVPIRVRFGQAFGTGEHATTRLCLRLLEQTLRPGGRVADLGTGTAILAMAAARLQAGPVLAADLDPVALRVARDNLADNGLAARVELRRADAAEACRSGPFDLILINIGASVIGRVLPDLGRAIRPGGAAILSGLLAGDEAALLERAGAAGLRLERRLRSGPWSALLVRREGAGG